MSVKRKCLMMSDLQSGAEEIEYVLASDYDAAQARIAELEDALQRIAANSKGLIRRAATQALENRNQAGTASSGAEGSAPVASGSLPNRLADHSKQRTCPHSALHFGSGDYYIFCHECGARWGHLSNQSGVTEYDFKADGSLRVGCDSTDCNHTLSGQSRQDAGRLLAVARAARAVLTHVQLARSYVGGYEDVAALEAALKECGV